MYRCTWHILNFHNSYEQMKALLSQIIFLIAGDPLYVGFDLTIASFDSISEVSMVSSH